MSEWRVVLAPAAVVLGHVMKPKKGNQATYMFAVRPCKIFLLSFIGQSQRHRRHHHQHPKQFHWISSECKRRKSSKLVCFVPKLILPSWLVITPPTSHQLQRYGVAAIFPLLLESSWGSQLQLDDIQWLFWHNFFFFLGSLFWRRTTLQLVVR